MSYLCILYLFFTFPSLITSIYEDQAGKFDWQQQYIGGIEHVAFDQCRQSTCKHVVVATDQNVVASLALNNGHIAWRQLLEKTSAGRIDDMYVVENNVVVVTGGGLLVRAFSTAVGSLVWEHSCTPDPFQQRARLGYIESDDDKSLVVLADNVVYGVSLKGQQLWEKSLPKSDGAAYTFMYTVGDTVTVVSTAPKSHVSMVTLRADGTQIHQATISAAWMDTSTSCGFTGSYFVCLDSINRIIHQVTLEKPDAFKSSLLQDSSADCEKPSLQYQGSALGRQGELVVSCGPTHSVMMKVDSTGISLVKDLLGVSAVQTIKYADRLAFVAVSRSPDEEQCQFRGYDLDSGLELVELSHAVPFPHHHGYPKMLYGLLRKRESTANSLMLVLSQDDSVALYHNNKLSWVREEALSKAVTVDMVDLPVSPILAKMEDEFGTDGGDILGMIFRRFSTQFVQVQAFIQQLKGKLRLSKSHHHMEPDSFEEDEEDEDYLFRDDFNLKKMILIATDVGKIFGLYSHTGRIIWRAFLPNLAPYQVAAGKKLLPMFMQRTTSHFPHDPHCILLGKHRETGKNLMYEFHPVSGQPANDCPPEGRTLNYKVVQFMLLSQMNDQFLHPLVILDSNFKYHVYPESSTDLVTSLASSMFMYTSDLSTGQLTGYAMLNSPAGLVAEVVWNLNLGRDGQELTNIKAKRAIEHVHSLGLVLADRSVLYKYLNPNLVVVTAESVVDVHKGVLNVYLVDAVSGQLIFHASHKKVRGPVTLVHSENWVVYTYWNQRHRRSEVAVLELYEGKIQSNATAFSSLHPPPLPMVLQQAYILSAHVSTMEATITDKGITSKHVLFALESGGILEMPKALLDPRRPEVPTQQHREEGIIPYMPELPKQTEAIINYNRSVYNIRGIHTSPAGLESHSMVLCYGLDLFYTRVMPSKMFDVLKEDFDYFFIGSVTLGMILISLVTKKLAVRKALNRAWK